MSDTTHFGPLVHLIGDWEGDGGLDVSYHHADGQPGETPYRETITFKPFGPVDNGRQRLYGLDYKMAAWRHGEDDPFHTELGYWLWDADRSEVMRAFVIPRGSSILAGGGAAADATSFTLRAEADSDVWGITSNPYLYENSRCIAYECNVAVDGDTFTYDETTTLTMKEFDQPYAHTDRNRLRRIATYEVPPPE